jgi:hypothetical protein
LAKSDGEWGIRWTEWKKDQRVNKEKFFSSQKAMDKFVEQQEKKDNFDSWGATTYPKEKKAMTLRDQVAKLASERPDLRKHLIPVLRHTAGAESYWDESGSSDTALEAGRQHGESGKGYGGETVRGPGKWEPEAKGKCFYETGDEGDRCYVTQNGGPSGQKKPGPSNKPGVWKDYEGQRWEKGAAFSNPMASTWSGKMALILAQYCDGSITTAADLQAAAATLLKVVLEMKKDAASFDDSTPERQIQDLCAQYHLDLLKKLKPAL